MEDTAVQNTCNDPGAARLGNFINYYQFNPAENRIAHLPTDLLRQHLKLDIDRRPVCLDIGCNSGVSRFLKLSTI